MDSRKTGIFYMGMTHASIKKFPGEFQTNLLKRLEPRFLIILCICSVLLFGLTFIFSLRPVADETTEKEILKIQERYARLVLDKPEKEVKKAVEEVKDVQKKKEKSSAEEQEEEKKEEKKVDRKKESYVQREERKKATQSERKEVRQKIAEQVQSTGLFAAITSSGSGGTSSSVSDMLGADADIGGVGDVDISSGTFAAKKTAERKLQRRKGEKVSGVDIQRESVGKVAGKQLASRGDVSVSSQKPTLWGDGGGNAERSQAAIGRMVTRYTSRLKRVYETWLKRDPQLGGRLTVKFTIMPDGQVTNVSVVKSTTGNKRFDSNILRYIKRWRFPAVSGAKPLEVVYPFVFEGGS